VTPYHESPKFIIARVIFDAISVPFILVFGYSLKFKVGWVFNQLFDLQIGAIYNHAQIEPYFQSIIVLVLIWTLSFYFSGVYKHYVGIMPMVDESVAVFRGVGLASLLIMAVTFFYPVIPGSRFVVLYSAIVALFWLVFGRHLLNLYEERQLKKGVGARNTLIIGADAIGQDVVEKLFLHPFYRLFYVGHIDDTYPEKVHFHLKNKLSLLGEAKDIERVCEQQNIDVIFMTKKLPKKRIEEILFYCERHNIECRQLVEDSAFMTGSIEVESFDGLPFFTHNSQSKYQYGLGIKRGFDFLVSVFSILCLSPVFICVGLLIKITSRSGPIFYFQERVGRGGRLFNMIKFRTMIPNAETSGPRMVDEKGDDRYIPCGQFLRKFSIDELPQLFNCILGDMSLVGPRPERPFFVDQFIKDIPHYALRHKLPVGLTGWAQINGRSVLTRRPEHKLKYDLYYIRNWSLLFDIKIILQTVMVVLKGEEAY
jgi:exopolysaccharide biosynthesis polyprenyl glycosylphosphotransferase